MKLRHLMYTFCLMFACTSVQAQPTEITVHVRAKGSKFIGSSMGGSRVVITDARTGKMLDEGRTVGGTGDTERIMQMRLRSTRPLSDENTARYTATIDLQSPTLVRVEAFGPLSQLQSAHTASATQWVIPGKHITQGDAFLIVLPGMVVDILHPAPSSSLELGSPIGIEAHIMMGCGCPIVPDGLWDASSMEIKGIVSLGNRQVRDIDLQYADALSRFQGKIEVDEPGVYEVLVYVYDPRNGNTGLDRTTFSLVK